MALAQNIDVALLDRQPFGLSHSLAQHPSLTLDSLSKLLTEMPTENVMFSKGLASVKSDFEAILTDGKKGLDLQEVIENLRTGDGYITVSHPELHPSFQGIFKELVADVGHYLKANGTGPEPLEPRMWLFIASPGAVTPFHFDRFSNFILQVRGSKELAVFPPRVEAVISAAETEAYVDRKPSYPQWSPEKDKYATKFNFKSGEAVHIPYVSGHYVKNGLEDISITISLFYHSSETKKWARAMRFNTICRRLGLRPRPIGHSGFLDTAKAMLHPVLSAAFTFLIQLRRGFGLRAR